MKLPRLLKRADFVRVREAGQSVATRTMIVQVLMQEAQDAQRSQVPALRIGLTASRKVGNAVLRNRARRRLRALAQMILVPKSAELAALHKTVDIVLVARSAVVTAPFPELVENLKSALKRMRI
jgi:ribonuclease P protein component